MRQMKAPSGEMESPIGHMNPLPRGMQSQGAQLRQGCVELIHTAIRRGESRESQFIPGL